MKGDYTTAINLFSQALAIDSNFTLQSINAFYRIWKSRIYMIRQKNVSQAYEKRDQMPIQQKIYTNWVYASFFETPYEEIKYIRQLLEIDDQVTDFLFSLG